jgi:hypothetical protein
MAFPPGLSSSIYLLLLIDTVFARSRIYEQEEPAHDGEDLEEVILRKVFVGVVLVKLDRS